MLGKDFARNRASVPLELLPYHASGAVHLHLKRGEEPIIVQQEVGSQRVVARSSRARVSGGSFLQLAQQRDASVSSSTVR